MPTPQSREVWIRERNFYLGMALLMLAAVVLGFARTFFLKPLFPEVSHLAPAERYFYSVHGSLFVAWMLLLVAQPVLIALRKPALHRRLGWLGALLALAVLMAGVYASLLAAARPGGFLGVPVPPERFLVVPLTDIALFAGFVVLAIALRRQSQVHKRCMLLATIGLLDAAVVRFPFADMAQPIVEGRFTLTDLGVDLFLLPMVLFDWKTLGRIHPATLWGGVLIVASQPLRMVVGESAAWAAFANALIASVRP
ncbi:MAG TPA: hypothetical protein VFV17_09550 [Usitatibacteraceae bacterium]|nr:hypothetical protein [Usitatibacteraceae bacterium]